jgi:myosin-3
MAVGGRLQHYHLAHECRYRYLRTQPADGSSKHGLGVSEDPEGNAEKFRELQQELLDLGFQDDQFEIICRLLAAILNLGEVRFKEEMEEEAELENPEVAAKGEEIFS